MLWIRFCPNEPISQELYYEGYQTDRDENRETPLFYWIKYRLDETIPQEMYYEDC